MYIVTMTDQQGQRVVRNAPTIKAAHNLAKRLLRHYSSEIMYDSEIRGFTAIVGTLGVADAIITRSS